MLRAQYLLQLLETSVESEDVFTSDFGGPRVLVSIYGVSCAFGC